MRRTLLVSILAAVVACSPSPPLEGIDLPPASLPDELEDSVWAIAFSHDFQPGFWEEGEHTYSMHLTCEAAIEEPLDSEVHRFESATRVPPFESPVYLRLAGISGSQFGPTGLETINPDQPTTAVVTVVGISEEDVAAAAECAGEIRYDHGQSAVLAPEEPVRP